MRKPRLQGWRERTERQGLACSVRSVPGRAALVVLGAREGEEHTTDFSYKHHRQISKLPGKKNILIYLQTAEISEQRTVSLGTA